MNSIREQYAYYGVDEYYKLNSENYENPHYPHIKKCLDWCIDKVDLSSFLDLGCGNGECSLYLKNKGFNHFIGMDKYFKKIFEKNTGKNCSDYSFENLALKGFPIKFKTIIVSYSIHLCEKTYQKQLIYQLSIICDNLIVISPNKMINYNDNILPYFELVNEVHYVKSHCKIYKSKNNGR